MPEVERRANLLGATWMIASMGAFGIEDAFIKAASAALPVGEVLVLFGLGGTLCFAVLARVRRQVLASPSVLSPAMAIRFLFETAGRLFYVLAVALIPLSSATVILQATPLLVVAGAALIFGETVGWRRWSAVVIGLIGVVIIVQPGADGFSTTSMLAVAGMVGFAGRDLASRAAPATVSTLQLGFYGFVAVILAGTVYSLIDGTAFQIPVPKVTAQLGGAVVFGVAAYACLMRAMRTGEISAVTPFRYTRLLFGVALGILMFNESPDAPTLIGSGLIVLSGLFIVWRGRTG